MSGRCRSIPIHVWAARRGVGEGATERAGERWQAHRSGVRPGWEDHAEAGDRQPEQDLTGCEQVGDARGAEHLELRQPLVVRRGPGEAGRLQLGVLCQTLSRASRRNRFDASRLSGCSPGRAAPRRAGGQLAVLGRDPPGEHTVDPLVVAASAAHQDGSAKSSSLIAASSAWGRS